MYRIGVRPSGQTCSGTYTKDKNKRNVLAKRCLLTDRQLPRTPVNPNKIAKYEFNNLGYWFGQADPPSGESAVALGGPRSREPSLGAGGGLEDPDDDEGSFAAPCTFGFLFAQEPHVF